MKNSIKILFAFMLMMVVSFAHAEEKATKEVKSVTFVSKKIDCDHCKQTIMKNIPYEKGVRDVKVDIAKQEIEVSYRNDKNSIENLTAALEKVGYPATVKKACCADKAEKKTCCAGKSEKKACCGDRTEKKSCCGDKAEKKSCCGGH